VDYHRRWAYPAPPGLSARAGRTDLLASGAGLWSPPSYARAEGSPKSPVESRADARGQSAAFSFDAQYRAHPAHSIFGGIARRKDSATAGSEVFVRISSSIAAA